MSNYALMFIIVLLLALLGTLILIFITVKYYWGERGTPPAVGEERKRLKEKELRLRAKQIELAKRNPIATRKSSFWDNSKVYNNREQK